MCLLSHHASCSASNEQPPSKAVKRAEVRQPAAGERDVSLHACFDLNGNIHVPGDAAGDVWEEPEAAIKDSALKSQEKPHCISQGRWWV